MSRLKLFSSLYLAGTCCTFYAVQCNAGSRSLNKFLDGERTRYVEHCVSYGSDYEDHTIKYEFESLDEAVKFELSQNLSDKIITSLFFPFVGFAHLFSHAIITTVFKMNKNKIQEHALYSLDNKINKNNQMISSAIEEATSKIIAR